MDKELTKVATEKFEFEIESMQSTIKTEKATSLIINVVTEMNTVIARTDARVAEIKVKVLETNNRVKSINKDTLTNKKVVKTSQVMIFHLIYIAVHSIVLMITMP